MNLPMIISTGLGTLDEVDEAVNVCKSIGNEKIAILEKTVKGWQLRYKQKCEENTSIHTEEKNRTTNSNSQ